jgi:cation diffusion facilitator family transporter
MRSEAVKLAVGSLVVGVIVLGLKYLAFWLTGSVALYSDALESIVNVVTAVVALVSVRIASKPADANHPFGHHKVEYFSAVIEGVMIVVAALLIVREARCPSIRRTKSAIVLKRHSAATMSTAGSLFTLNPKARPSTQAFSSFEAWRSQS